MLFGSSATSSARYGYGYDFSAYEQPADPVKEAQKQEERQAKRLQRQLERSESKARSTSTSSRASRTSKIFRPFGGAFTMLGQHFESEANSRASSRQPSPLGSEVASLISRPSSS